MPIGLSFEASATLGVAGLTAAMTLWRWLQVPQPTVESIAQSSHCPSNHNDDRYLLIWGGAATTGQYAIQLSRLSGVKIICVASERSSSLCLSLGASHVVTRDGKSADEIISEIRAIAKDSITMAVDLVGTQTAEHCLQAVSQRKQVLFAPLAMISKNSTVPANVKVETVEMKRFVLDPENVVYAKRLNELVQAGHIKVPALEVIEGGLATVVDGLRRLRNGDTSGKKMVVTIP
jgi:NADPH:quinone reductase-like Zn-dependent oxidoreductase